MLKLVNLIAIVSMTIVICYSRNSLAQEALTTFYKLHEAGKSLESASAMLAGERNEETVYFFVRAPKSATCDRYFSEVVAVVDQYRIKTLDFVKESQQPKTWFSGFKRAVGPLGGMRSLSRDFPYLREATEAIVQHSNVEKLSDDDVHCSLAKFQIDSLSKVMFVLQTEIKLVIIEKPELVNRAILRQINEAKRTANHNFYGVEKLSPVQRRLVKHFYLARVDEHKVTVGEATDHFDSPTSLVLGRLYDACHALLTYAKLWEQLESEEQESCSKSRLASKKTGAIAPKLKEYNLVGFCDSFIHAA